MIPAFTRWLSAAISLSRGDLRYTPAGAAYLATAPDTSGGLLTDIQQDKPIISFLETVFTGGIPVGAPQYEEDPVANGIDTSSIFGPSVLGGGGDVVGDATGASTTPWGDTVDPSTGVYGAGPADSVFTGIGDVLGSSVLTGGGFGGGVQGSGGMIRTAGSASAMGSIGGIAVRMSSIVAGAILKLKQSIGGGGFLTAGGISSFGAKTWRALSAWAAKNPAVSIISILVSLGLTVEEAAHFMAWGTAKRRHRRARGITPRDMRTTRRTMIKVINMSQKLRQLCVAVPHRTFHRKAR